MGRILRAGERGLRRVFLPAAAPTGRSGAEDCSSSGTACFKQSLDSRRNGAVDFDDDVRTSAPRPFRAAVRPTAAAGAASRPPHFAHARQSCGRSTQLIQTRRATSRQGRESGQPPTLRCRTPRPVRTVLFLWSLVGAPSSFLFLPSQSPSSVPSYSPNRTRPRAFTSPSASTTVPPPSENTPPQSPHRPEPNQKKRYSI